MSSAIVWTDIHDGGVYALGNGNAAPGDRFANWVPRSKSIGPKQTALGTRIRYAYSFATDYGATFELHDIPHGFLAHMDKLAWHLDDGGQVTVYTGDSNDAVYGPCVLTEGADPPEPDRENAPEIRYGMSFALTNLGGVPMTVWYADAGAPTPPPLGLAESPWAAFYPLEEFDPPAEPLDDFPTFPSP